MDIMSQVWIKIIVAVICTIIWEIIGVLFPKIKTPVGLLLSLFHYKKVIVFSNFNDSKIKKYIHKGLENSKKLKYLSIRGFPLVQETYELNKALNKHYNVSSEYQIMIIDPKDTNAKIRAEEYAIMEPSSNITIYLNEINSTITAIMEMKKIMPKIKLKLHNTIPIFRICICDKYCFLSFYTAKYMGKNSPVFLFNSNTVFYEVLEYYFDYVWKILPEYDTVST